MLEFSVRTHRGRVREKNQDSYYVPSGSGINVFAVADGMGGHAAGEVASSLCIQALNENIVEHGSNLMQFDRYQMKQFLQNAVLDGNDRILSAQKENAEFDGMGTTITAAVFMVQEILVGHVGDSQAHLFNKDGHYQITEDHSLVMELLKNGEIQPDEIRSHPQRHMLTRALGTSPQLIVDFYFTPFNKDDYLLLCTDGLTSMLQVETIQEIVLGQERSLGNKVDQLIHRANATGGLDNITVVLVRA